MLENDIDCLVQDCNISIANTHWRYCSLALSHRYENEIQVVNHGWSVSWVV